MYMLPVNLQSCNKDNKHSLYVDALYCRQMSNVTWKDDVDLAEINCEKC